MRKHVLEFTAVALFALPHASAVSKEMVQLQTQVQQLQDAVQHLQTSNDERMGVIVNLVQQNTDNVNRMMSAVNALQSTLKAESENRGATNTQLSTQIQSLNDSVDELKTRIANLTTQVQSHAGPDAERERNAGAARRRSSCRGKYAGQSGPWRTGCCTGDTRVLKRLPLTSFTKALFAITTPPSTTSPFLSSAMLSTTTRKTRWRETPNFI